MKRSRCPVCGVVIPVKELLLNRTRLSSDNWLIPIRSLHCGKCGSNIIIHRFWTNPARLLGIVLVAGLLLYLGNDIASLTEGETVLFALFLATAYWGAYLFDEFTPD